MKTMSIEEMRLHEWVVSWSGGKDSTATIILSRNITKTTIDLHST